MADVADNRSAIFDAALDAIVTVDHQGRILEFNPAAERTFNLSRDQACGRLLVETIIPERFRDAHRVRMQQYLETGETTVLGRRIEIMALRDGGIEFPVELAIIRVPNVDPPIFTGFIRDLTERRRLERRRAAGYRVVQIVISDNGAGIAAEVLPHIFALFRQGRITGSLETGGLGLGLAIVRRLVELHGGSVHAASEGEGRDSVFTVTLPLAIQEQAA